MQKKFVGVSPSNFSFELQLIFREWLSLEFLFNAEVNSGVENFWISRVGFSCSKLLGGSIVEVAFYLSDIHTMTARDI